MPWRVPDQILAGLLANLSSTLAKLKADFLVAAKSILRYIKGTIDYELCFKKMDEDVNLIAFNDSDWASSLEDRRSTYCFSLTKQGLVISWKSTQQATLALSTREAEYMTWVNTTQESMDPTQLLNGMDNKVYSCTKINGDNQGAIALVGTERGPNTLMLNNTLFVICLSDERDWMVTFNFFLCKLNCMVMVIGLRW